KYSVGDYVWEDTNKDGIQDDKRKGNFKCQSDVKK
ncbi:hypothetical protein HMPREF9993_12045, partial [Staphylococcus epidermidis NIHLM087]